ncbi:MAG: hypothetical protein J0H01_14135 [Rhizobiales bacterium]|nr:hypothetical protein [Hyphomicrobiales bacterium]
MTSIRFCLLGLAAFALSACQTAEQAASRNVQSVCAQNGYGPGTQHHDYCVLSLTPYAMQLEQQRRAALIANGVALIAASRQQAPTPAGATTIDPPRNNLENRPIWCMRSNIGNNIVCN